MLWKEACECKPVRVIASTRVTLRLGAHLESVIGRTLERSEQSLELILGEVRCVVLEEFLRRSTDVVREGGVWGEKSQKLTLKRGEIEMGWRPTKGIGRESPRPWRERAERRIPRGHFSAPCSSAQLSRDVRERRRKRKRANAESFSLTLYRSSGRRLTCLYDPSRLDATVFCTALRAIARFPAPSHALDAISPDRQRLSRDHRLSGSPKLSTPSRPQPSNPPAVGGTLQERKARNRPKFGLRRRKTTNEI